MKGFRCAGCGRALDELRACKYSHERFYCSEFCSEDDESERPSLSIWDFPISVGWGARLRGAMLDTAPLDAAPAEYEEAKTRVREMA